MQQTNTELQQQASVRLQRQLSANRINETTSPIQHNNAYKITNRSGKLIDNNQEQWLARRLQTDPYEFDTHRSLSSCPTYLSLSRHSPETRECGTQITTSTPIPILDDNQELANDSPSPPDNNQSLILDEIPVEEVELMPISSGFGYYPYNYPTTTTQRVVQPQIKSRAPEFRDKAQDGINSNSKTTSGGRPPQRPTAVKQSPRSDTSVSPTKRNDANSKLLKVNPAQNGSRRPPPPPVKEFTVKNSLPPSDKSRIETNRRNGATRLTLKPINSPPDQQDFGRRPVRLANKNNHAYYPDSPPVYYQKSAPLSRDASDRPRRMRIANSEYVIQRRKQPSAHAYDDDYPPETPIEKRNSQRVVRVVRDAPHRDDDDVYYVESAAPRRPTVIRRSPPKEYIYLDEPPPSVRHHRSRRSEVVYVDDDQSTDHEDDYMYVDEDGNEVDFVPGRNTSPHYVEYAGNDKDKQRSRKSKSKVVYVDDDDDNDKRRSHKSKVIYVDDDDDKDKRRSHKTKVIYVDDDDELIQRKPKQSGATRIVYD